MQFPIWPADRFFPRGFCLIHPEGVPFRLCSNLSGPVEKAMPAHMLKAQFVYSYSYSFFSAAAIFAAILRTIDYVNGESLNGHPAGFPPPLLLTQTYHIEKQKSIRKR
ncbi:MAG: hypothetical protein V3T31_13615, partial [candidate division Zixibacteria bacterium]